MTKETKEMTPQGAISVLIQAARIGQEKGAYTLEDARIIADAIDLFAPKDSKESTDSNENTTSDSSDVVLSKED